MSSAHACLVVESVQLSALGHRHAVLKFMNIFSLVTQNIAMKFNDFDFFEHFGCSLLTPAALKVLLKLIASQGHYSRHVRMFLRIVSIS